MDIKKGFTTKVGKVPVYVWGGAAVVLYLGYAYWNMSKGSGGSSGAVTDDSGFTTVPTPSESYEEAYRFDDGLDSKNYPNAASSTNPVTDTSPQTNADWAKQAINLLIAQGITPTEALAAINSYVFSGWSKLNAQQTAAVNVALSKLGAPPNPITAPPTTPPTTPKPTPKPTPNPAVKRVPGSVTALSAKAVGGTVSVYWSAPTSTGGSAITQYRWIVYSGTTTVGGGTTKATIVDKAGFKPGLYSISVWAMNAQGQSPAATTTVRVT